MYTDLIMYINCYIPTYNFRRLPGKHRDYKSDSCGFESYFNLGFLKEIY